MGCRLGGGFGLPYRWALTKTRRPYDPRKEWLEECQKLWGQSCVGYALPIHSAGGRSGRIVVDSVMEAVREEGIVLQDRDVVAATEAIVARAQGNYASVDAIAADVRSKFPSGHIGVLFPILSRNRFAICLRGIARGADKITLMLSYPSDEVGNHLIDPDIMDEKGVNPWSDVLTESRYRELFGYVKHTFTGVDYVEYYTSLIREEGAEVEVLFANAPGGGPFVYQGCSGLRYPYPKPEQTAPAGSRCCDGFRPGRHPDRLRGRQRVQRGLRPAWLQ